MRRNKEQLHERNNKYSLTQRRTKYISSVHTTAKMQLHATVFSPGCVLGQGIVASMSAVCISWPHAVHFWAAIQCIQYAFVLMNICCC